MDAHTLAARLRPDFFRGTYHKESDTYPDLKHALVAIAGPEAEVHVQQRDYGTIRPVTAFAQKFWPDAVLWLGDRSVGVEAKLLRHPQEGGTISSAIAQALFLTLDHDEALIVFLRTDGCPPFTERECQLLDELWPSQRIATAVVSIGAAVPEIQAEGAPTR